MCRIKKEDHCVPEGNGGSALSGTGRIDGNVISMYNAVAMGDEYGAGFYTERLFDDIMAADRSFEETREHCVDIFVKLLLKNARQNTEENLKAIAMIAAATDPSEIRELFLKHLRAIAKGNSPESAENYSSLIKETIHIINQNIGNENLSLRWIAGNVLYANVDYLGKLFKKETGRNFSHYVMEKRMEIAKRSILEGSTDKIYEVAAKVGYGTNSQYFSQVFKKYTGVSPLEYKEYARSIRKSPEELHIA